MSDTNPCVTNCCGEAASTSADDNFSADIPHDEGLEAKSTENPFEEGFAIERGLTEELRDIVLPTDSSEEAHLQSSNELYSDTTGCCGLDSCVEQQQESKVEDKSAEDGTEERIDAQNNDYVHSTAEEITVEDTIVDQETDHDVDALKPKLVTTVFEEGPLGVSLRRKASNGVVFVNELVPDSQAIDLDIEIGDELWAVGSNELGETTLDKETWMKLIQFIKDSPRPLEMTWLRRPQLIQTQLHQVASVDEVTVQTTSPDPASEGSTAESCTVQQVPTETNERFEQLKRFVSRLVPKEKDHVMNAFVGKQRSNSSNSISSFQQQLDATGYHSLIAPGRMILKIGELDVPAQQSILWIQSRASAKRIVALSNDMLIITIPQLQQGKQLPLLQVEYVIDLQTCKLRSLGQVFSGGNNSSDLSEAQKKESQLSFQVMWPGGSIDFLAESKEEKEVWVLNIFLAICNRVEHDSGKVLGWRHQYMLGTMHSAVLSRDEERVRELVAMCEEGQIDFSSLDCQDEDGYTPLHYACILRMTNMVRILHEATADVTAPDFQGWTPLHWAAMQLDDYSLDLLCAHVFDLDHEDNEKRTPLYMACVEGRDIRGMTDTLALSRCLSFMLTHHPNINFVDWKGFSILHYLSAGWQNEPTELLLKAGANVHAIYIPLQVSENSGGDVSKSNHSCSSNESNHVAVSPRGKRTKLCRGMNSLHFAASATPLKSAVGLGKAMLKRRSASTEAYRSCSDAGDERIGFESLNKSHQADTVRLLLKFGARPNSKDSLGRTPLMLLAEVYKSLRATLVTNENAADTSAPAEPSSAVTTSDKTTNISDGVDMEDVINAASTLISFGARWDENSAILSEMKSSTTLNISALIEKWSSLQAINGDELNICLNHYEAIHNVSGSPLSPEVNANADSCLLCSFKFTLFKRQHHCRICNAICCDECSKKRCIIDGNQVRCCDSCFNHLMTLEEEKRHKHMISNMKPLPKMTNAYVNSPEYQKEKLERQRQERCNLLGDAGTGTSTNGTEAAQGSVDQTLDSLREARQRLAERGEKLAQLGDRTEQMSDQASEFARLARQLNEQQKNRWF